MYICCVPGCKEKTGTFHFHSFPNPKKDMHLYSIWVKRIGNLEKIEPDKVHKNRRVCQRHFDPFCYAERYNRLKRGSIPTLHLPYFSGDSLKNCNIRFLDGYKDSEFGFLKDSTNIPQIPDLKFKKTVVVNEDLHDKKEDLNTYNDNNLFTITGDNIESIINACEKNSEDPLELGTKDEDLMHKNYADYKKKTDQKLKEMDTILKFLTKTDRIYNCPKCKYKCVSFSHIKTHLLVHAENRDEMCFQYSCKGNKLLLTNINCLGTIENISDHQYSLKDHQYLLKDHQYSLKK